jgi:DNA-directed RNA polymerase subunit M/transcription elongation factor TFIIS
MGVSGNESKKTEHVSEALDYRIVVKDYVIKKVPELSDDIAGRIEKGIYNWAIIFSEEKHIIKSWSDKRFKNTYFNKSRNVLACLDKSSYLNHDLDCHRDLINKIINGEFNPDKIPFMKPHELMPSKWNEYIEKKHKKDDNMCNTKQIAKTDQFKCSRCKKRECSYYELQVRSADESSTIFITCLNCSHRWRIG